MEVLFILIHFLSFIVGGLAFFNSFLSSQIQRVTFYTVFWYTVALKNVCYTDLKQISEVVEKTRSHRL
jgi:hypothetical protein